MGPQDVERLPADGETDPRNVGQVPQAGSGSTT